MVEALRSFTTRGLRGIDEDHRTVTAVISTGDIARDNAVIEPGGWDFTHYDANPVVLYGHDAGGLPIGTTLSHEVNKKERLVTATARIFDGGFADEVWNVLRQGGIRATSVRWNPFEWGYEPRKDYEHAHDGEGEEERHEEEEDKILVFRRQELLEWSLVTVPADPKALIVRADGSPLVVEDFVAERGAIGAHSTGTTDTPWDGPAAVAAAPNERAVLRYMHAWVESGADPDAKQSYKFPHHAPRQGSPANLGGVRNGLARLPQANIPGGDRAGVEAHLRRHLEAQESSLSQLTDEIDFLRDLLEPMEAGELRSRLDGGDLVLACELHEHLSRVLRTEELPRTDSANDATTPPGLERLIVLLEKQAEEPPVEEVVARALAGVTGKSPERIRQLMAERKEP